MHLRKNWSNPSSDKAFQGASKLYKYYAGKVTLSEILEILKTFESYSIMRIEHSSKNRRYQGFNFSTWLWNIAEVDSFSVQELSDDNMGVQHIMAVVNNFSKKAFVSALMDRSAKSGLEAISDIFSLAGNYTQLSTLSCTHSNIQVCTRIPCCLIKVGNVQAG